MARSATGQPPRLADADLGRTIGRKAYDRTLEELQQTLVKIQQAYLFSGRSGVIVFEGWDAAGKGGTIRRISSVLDPRGFKVWPIGAPRPYYKERHYLTRFMERMPPTGAISAFDRSWYGRVLVERVEGLTPKARWKAAYREINEFERLLVDDGIRIVKLFFHISRQEQLKRFEARLREPMKRWKLSYEDFRNRSRWDDYEAAIDEMFAKTSSRHAPWTLIPSEDKRYGRIAAIREIVRCLGRGVDLSPPAIDERVLEEAGNHFSLTPSLVETLSGRTD